MVKMFINLFATEACWSIIVVVYSNSELGTECNVEVFVVEAVLFVGARHGDERKGHVWLEEAWDCMKDIIWCVVE